MSSCQERRQTPVRPAPRSTPSRTTDTCTSRLSPPNAPPIPPPLPYSSSPHASTIPRDGRNIHASQLISALREGLHLSLPLSLFLTFGSYLLLGQFRHLSLADLARHGAIEHNASLAHTDAHASAEYAPCRIDKKALAALLRDSADGRVLTARDVAHARVRREGGLRVPLDRVHAEIARGEMALVLGVFGQRAGAGGGAAETEAPLKDKVTCELLEDWWNKERFPKNWQPTRVQGLLQTVCAAADIRKAMEEQKAMEEERRAR